MNIVSKNLQELPPHHIKFVFTDIDDTLTEHGKLGPNAYSALWELYYKGFHIIPVTGRPAGWCEMIARFWPVAGVVGENGGFYFRYHNNKMHRVFAQDQDTRNENLKKIDTLKKVILKQIPEADVASDQFTRLIDLAIDYCEDVKPLTDKQIKTIVQLFHQMGAQAKVSSIHINGWFGNHDKSSMSFRLLKNEFNIEQKEAQPLCAFVGDSPNDEPLFRDFESSFAVANIKPFLAQMKFYPRFISAQPGGSGFVDIASALIRTQNRK